MKFLTIDKNGSYDLGVKTEREVINVTAALTRYPSVKKIPQTVHEIIEGGEEAVHTLNEYINGLAVTSDVSGDILLHHT
jgi:hypothetical protein